MPKSLVLAGYLGFTTTRLADRLAKKKLNQRIEMGKEDPARLNERFGAPTAQRPEGSLVWFHAASVGETLSLLELIRQIKTSYPDTTLLVTTATRSAANILETRMPEDVIHQYVPVDTRSAVTGFLKHWAPDLAIWTESEFWPRLMVETKRLDIPMVLINGRISDETARSWGRFGGATRSLFDRFDLMLVQTIELAEKFIAIGAPKDRIKVTGSLKEGAIPLPCDDNKRKDVVKQIGHRPVWFAGSTHEGEEEVVASAHKLARKSRPELLLILAPRHPERGVALREYLDGQGFNVAQRSKGEKPTDKTDVLLADTLGEMGIWYRVAPVSLVGGSLKPIGGHNPFEPAALGSAIVHGPNVFNFQDIYNRLAEGGASHCVRTDAELAAAVVKFLQPDQAAESAAAAWAVSSEGAGVTDAVMALLEPYIQKALG